jgi:S-(hydroxymethyl)glutathione dehydrogenase/alcohol dehydrogenase
MRAVILEKQRSPLKIEDVRLLPLLHGQVLVKVEAASICGAQLREISGAKGKDFHLPHLLGHEGAGIVLDCGFGVTTVKKGDHVVMHWRKGEGIDAAPPKYRRIDGSLVGAGPVATFAEQAVVSENRITAIQNHIRWDVASLFGCAITTAFGLINNEAQLKIGQSIAVAGCGGVGLAIVLGASLVSACPIVAIDPVDEKLNIASSLGASIICKPNKAFRSNMDVFVDCTGNTEVIEAGLRAVRPGGKLILVGQPPYGHDLKLPNVQQHYQGKTIMDSQGGLTDPTNDIPRYLNLIYAKGIDVSVMITHRFPLEQINEAIKMMQDGATGRCMLIMR